MLSTENGVLFVRIVENAKRRRYVRILRSMWHGHRLEFCMVRLYFKGVFNKLLYIGGHKKYESLHKKMTNILIYFNKQLKNFEVNFLSD